MCTPFLILNSAVSSLLMPKWKKGCKELIVLAWGKLKMVTVIFQFVMVIGGAKCLSSSDFGMFGLEI